MSLGESIEAVPVSWRESAMLKRGGEGWVMGGNRRKRWVVPVVVAFLGFVVVMIGASAFFMSRWSSLQSTDTSGANLAFAEARDLAGGGTPYLTISSSQKVEVHRELEGSTPVPLHTLHVIAWDSGLGRLLRVDFPFWFVRLKMTSTLNLGTYTSALARDWENLELKVAEDDLERRGPGLILDIRTPDGDRLLLWTE